YHALLQTVGDAAMFLAADLQEPPALIKDFIKKWEEGYKIIIGVKNKSRENRIMFTVRKLYYDILKKFADVEQIKNFNGFGLYDRAFIDIIKKFDDPYPYFRGTISEVGFERAEIGYVQAVRKKGRSHSTFYDLYDIAMLGFVNHSKAPLRLASFIGFGMSIMSFLVALIYFIRKLLQWQDFQLGLAPLVVGIFFIGSIQLFFIGILGEYIGAIYTQVKHRPLVIEKERINFDK
ncbi:glycosyltransferase, partial [Patescibacteria group bacterium]|nr:glycosyltransferase [Patescibacteria group bacterium]